MKISTSSSVSTIIIFFFLIISQILGKKLILTQKHQTLAFYNCFKSSGFDKIVIEVSPDFDHLDIQNVINAGNAGLNLQIFTSICRNMTAQDYYQQYISHFNKEYINKIWVIPYDDQDSPSSPCSWSNYPPQQNCKYLQNMIQFLSKYKIQTNVITNKYFWSLYFGSVNSCPEVNVTKLWWLPYGNEQDLQPNFNNYQQVGGWKLPYLKFYGEEVICGATLPVNYYQ